MTDALSCHIHLPICFWIMDPHSRGSKKNTSHGNEVIRQYTMHLIQRPYYQRGCPCRDLAGSHKQAMQTAVVWACLPFIRSGQNHFARHNERGRRRGRQRKRWEDNIREWTGLEFAKSQRAVENGESSVVPQRPSRLRDWWWWWWWWWFWSNKTDTRK